MGECQSSVLTMLSLILKLNRQLDVSLHFPRDESNCRADVICLRSHNYKTKFPYRLDPRYLDIFFVLRSVLAFLTCFLFIVQWQEFSLKSYQT